MWNKTRWIIEDKTKKEKGEEDETSFFLKEVEKTQLELGSRFERFSASKMTKIDASHIETSLTIDPIELADCTNLKFELKGFIITII